MYAFDCASMLAPDEVFHYNNRVIRSPEGGILLRILVTNDDGIYSVGLKALAEAAIRRGHKVTVSAPSSQCSANSQHITLTQPLLAHEISWPGATAFAIDGTPTDCARIAPFMVDEPFDFCLSGINNGENAGSAVYYSGTVAAAREAAMCNIPAMAVSIMPGADDSMRSSLADIAVRVAEHFEGVHLPRFSLINLNAPAIPPEELKPMRMCPLCQAYYLDGYEKRVSPLGQTYFWLKANDDTGVPMEPAEPGSDYDYLRKGHVTCTVLGNFRDYNEDYLARMQDFLK